MSPMTRSLLAFSFITLLFFSLCSLVSGGHHRGSLSAALVLRRERSAGHDTGMFKSARTFESDGGKSSKSGGGVPSSNGSPSRHVINTSSSIRPLTCFDASYVASVLAFSLVLGFLFA